MRNIFREVVEVLSRPSADPRPNPQWYRWATNQTGHTLVVGACAATLPLTWLLVTIYVVRKEGGDLRRGGTLRDGALDTAFVALGATYAGPAVWPWTMLAALSVGVVIQIATRQGDPHA